MSDHPRRAIVVTHDGGLRFSAQIGSHRLIVDKPVDAGGTDTGPAPRLPSASGVGEPRDPARDDAPDANVLALCEQMCGRIEDEADAARQMWRRLAR